jgi:hypothetical protein
MKTVLAVILLLCSLTTSVFSQGGWGSLTLGQTNIYVDNIPTNASAIGGTNLAVFYTDPSGDPHGIITNSQQVVVEIVPASLKALSRVKFLAEILPGTNSISAIQAMLIGLDAYRNTNRIQDGNLDIWWGVGYIPADPDQGQFVSIRPSAIAGLYEVEIRPARPFVFTTNRLIGPITLVEGTNSFQLSPVFTTNAIANLATYVAKWDGTLTPVPGSAAMLVELVDVLEFRITDFALEEGAFRFSFASGFPLESSTDLNGVFVAFDREPYIAPYYIAPLLPKRFFRLTTIEHPESMLRLASAPDPAKAMEKRFEQYGRNIRLKRM